MTSMPGARELPVFLIPFAVFFACCLAQFYFLERVKRALADRHPEVLQGLTGKSFFSGSGINRFIWRRADRALNDPDLTDRVMQFNRLTFVAIGAWGLGALSILTGVANWRLSPDALTRDGLGVQTSNPVTTAVQPAAGNVSNSFPFEFGTLFGGALVVNIIYLALVWRLCERWNALRLGPTATIGDPMTLMGVLLWSTPAAHDAGFLRLRLVTRAAGILALVGTLAVFVLTASAER